MTYVPVSKRPPRSERRFVVRRSLCANCNTVVEFVREQGAPERWTHQHGSDLCFADEQLVAEPAPARTR